MDNKHPLVSICCLAFNHEPYIAKTIKSFLMQKTNFAFEILIHDDASNDRTANIISAFEKKYPDIVKPIYQKENNYSKGIMVSSTYQFPRVKGKYIAFCEGDDYWTDPYKLQKQVDFLKNNPDYGMVCTNYDKLFESNKKIVRNVFTKYKNEITFDDYLLDRSSIGTATVLIRTDIIKMYEKDIPFKIRKEWDVGDVPIWLYTMIKSKVAVLPDSTAMYRIRDNSACHFTNIHEHYKFIKKGYKIPYYFIKRYGCSDLVKKKLVINFHKITLNYGFQTMNSVPAKKSYNILKENDSLKMLDLLRFIGSYNLLFNKIASFFIWMKLKYNLIKYGKNKIIV